MKAGTWFTDKLNEFESDQEFRTEKVIIDFTEKVVAAMRERDMSRVELALRLGVSKAFVTKLLNGNPNLTIRTMVSLAAALECELLVDIQPRAKSSHDRLHKTNRETGVAYCHEPAAAEAYGKGKK